MRTFFTELTRRRVFRVAAAYAIVGWLLIQIATQVFPFFDLPTWSVRLIVLLILAGFPIAMVLAWAFDVTPEGIIRTDESGQPVLRRARSGTLSVAALGVVIALVAGAGYWMWHRTYSEPEKGSQLHSATHIATVSSDRNVESDSDPVSAKIPAKSIAVLPFENLSSDKDNAYFSDAMQDLILTKLADIGDLKVISRTSTLSYGSHPQNLKIVGQQLGVAILLEGSVQKSGNQVLINVQLIDARSDSHIWAQSYQRTLDNVFGVEGEVAQMIATELKAKLSPAETVRIATSLSKNNAANDLFLRAEYFTHLGDNNYDTARWKSAIPLYRQALQLDPDFVLALARVSYTESELVWFGGGGVDVKQLTAQARSDAEHALQLAPDLPASQVAIGYSDYYGRGDYAGALKAFAAVLVLRPNDIDALAAKAYVERRQGHFDAAIEALHQAVAYDPRNSRLAFVLGDVYSDVSRYTDAENWYGRALALDPDNGSAKIFNSQAILFSSGDIPRALSVVQGDDPALKLQRVSLLTYQRKYQEALTLLASIDDTPDNFSSSDGSKLQWMADLYRLAGDSTRARTLYAQTLPKLHAQLDVQQGIRLAFVWQTIADTELGLGHIEQALDAIGKAQAISAKNPDHVYGPGIMHGNAALFAEAGHPDLAIPLLASALATPGVGRSYSPVMLWIDPAWDPIRQDPGFLALLKKYAEFAPTVASLNAKP